MTEISYIANKKHQTQIKFRRWDKIDCFCLKFNIQYLCGLTDMLIQFGCSTGFFLFEDANPLFHTHPTLQPIPDMQET